MGLFGKKGKVRIRLDAEHVAAGDPVTGQVKVDIKKGLEARRIIATLRATQTRKDYDTNGFGSRQVEDVDVNILYEQEVEIAPAQMMNAGTHGPFTFSIPTPAPEKPRGKVKGMLGKVLDLATQAEGDARYTTWEVLVRVDTKGFDLRGRTEVNVA